MKRIPALAIFILVTFTTLTTAQYVADLNGFRIGQVRSVTHTELGEPSKSGPMGDRISYEAFLISEDPLLYMVFQYHESEPDKIWSIQITGSNDKHDLRFKGLRMGMPPAEVEKLIGKADKTFDVGQHGTRWEYDAANFSVEIDPTKKLSSVRIGDDRDKEPDVKTVPEFKAFVQKFLRSTSNKDLAEMLAPDMEIYEGERVTSFRYRMQTEIDTDKSGVFAALRRLAAEIKDVKPDSSEVDVNLRLRHQANPLHVFKFPKHKNVKEIVFDWNGAEWVVWEFGSGVPKKANAADDWRTKYKAGTLSDLVSVKIPELIKTPNAVLKKADQPFAGFSYGRHTTAVRVKFTGEQRPTTESTSSLISAWVQTLGQSKELADQFKREYGFTEGAVSYWLPTHDSLFDRFAKELKAGDEMVAYVSWAGYEYRNGKPDLLAVVDGFDKVGAAPSVIVAGIR